MPMVTQQYCLPDLFAICRRKCSVNPHYERAGAESSAWVISQQLFPNKRRLAFVLGNNELLASRAYPRADYDRLRTCLDFINLLFVVDEISDEQSGEDALKTGLIVIKTMQDPSYADDSQVAKITREFRVRLLRHARPNFLRRFLKTWEDYAIAFAQEAELRENGQVLDVQAYTELRRENSGVRPCFHLIEYAAGSDIPDEVFANPTFEDLFLCALDMISWSNDLYSYNVEQSKGQDGNNIIRVLMEERNLSLQEACDYVGVYFQDLMDRFQSSRQKLPSWGVKTDKAVSDFLDGLENWVATNLEWSFLTQRYFGPSVAEVRQTRLVTLQPKVHGNSR
ncbi:terpenoid synthase [Gloeophyllum trabeum ATCC 11539]|uniref:Terpene synthase n=1 Tax=Gloeophyllum trabeum (strain ATCC 11539 / FP-39264 / Madison 617) TaxID=670483 RepID=S7Q774_GLOTA|nr:terpenoid synthase [Gloeophyllum trabeum ATCC 11539]EPQ55293.1 terpenoid synthase [Gloeophyllum trabeum ATCC 11539]